MKLLIEQHDEYRTLYESEGDKKSLFIEGVFMQADIKNRNGRIYPKPVLDKEVKRYMKESVERKNAFGELNHPPTPQINLDRVSHIIVSLKEDGSNYIGKAKILETPMGLIVKNIIEGGGQLAVSSRGTGSLKNIGGTMQVKEDFRLATAADIVGNPSAPSAYVSGLYEGVMDNRDWFFNQITNQWEVKAIEEELNRTTKARILAEETQLLESWKKFMKAISS